MESDAKQLAGKGKWLALAAALLGWMFDGMEMGVFSMVGRPAVKDLLGTIDEGVIGRWFGVVVAATPRLGELRRGETIPWRVIAARIARHERRDLG